MTDGESYAYPKHGQASNGLTKREAFAMASLKGAALHLQGANDREIQDVADTAVRLADALVAALNRPAVVDLGAVHDEGGGF